MPDSERVKLIMNHWRDYRGDAMRYFLKGHGVFRCPVRRPMPVAPIFDGVATPTTIETLEFLLEHGGRDGKPWSHVVCEGVEVEAWPRARA